MYLQIISKRQKKSLTQEERDQLFGLYYIFYEEFLLSLFNIPHFLLLPAKIIGAIWAFITPISLKGFVLGNPNYMLYIPEGCELLLKIMYDRFWDEEVTFE